MDVGDDDLFDENDPTPFALGDGPPRSAHPLVENYVLARYGRHPSTPPPRTRPRGTAGVRPNEGPRRL